MINLSKTKEIGKRIVLSTCLISLFGTYAAPLADAVQTSPVQASVSQDEQTRNVVLKGGIKLAKGDQKVAVSLRDSDVKQVLRMFADKAGLNVVFHKSVDGKITLDLVNVTLNDAFNTIMQMAELTYVIENDTLMVASSEESKKLNFTRENMAVIPVKYINSGKLAEFLNKNIFTKSRPGLSNSEVAVANLRDNEILIFGSKGDYNVAKKVIEEIDKPLRITSFKVNHTTPKEMATLACETWLKEKGTEGTELTDNSESEIVVGGGVVACSIDSEDEDQGEMKSLETQGLKIAYFPTQGVVKLYGGTSQQADDMRKFVEDADKKQPQAILEMSVVELNETGSKTISNTWNIYSRFFTGTIGGSAGIATSDTLRPMMWTNNQLNNQGMKPFYDYKDYLPDGSLKPGATPISAVSKWIGAPIITTNINWLISNRDGRVLATPKVMITNGQESVIDLTSDYVASVNTQYIQNGSLTPQIQRTYNIANDNGMKISLTPFISPDGYVSMNIKPEYATIKEKVPNEYGDTAATLLQRRSLDLKNIRIKDGETLVLGGLIQEVEQKTIDKPPIIGDIPGIGWLFRSSGSTKEKQELVIMITPHIIKDSEDLVEAQSTESL